MESTGATASVFPRPRSAGDDPTELQRLLRLARVHLGMDVAMVSQVRGEQFVITAVSGDGAAMKLVPEAVTSLATSFCVRVFTGSLPAVNAETRRHPMTRESAVTELGIGSYVGVPLLRPDGTAVGLLCCLSRTATVELSAQAERFLTLIAELVVDHLEVPAAPVNGVVLAEGERVHSLLKLAFVRMVFQSIVRLDDGVPVGYEALARFDDPYFPSPAHAFAAAARAGIGVELELLAVQHAFARLPDLPAGVWLGVNLSAEALLFPAVQEALLSHQDRRIGVEVTEHTEVRDYVQLLAVTDRLRDAGIQVAVDDAGAGYASFRHILKLRPSVIKLDLEIVRDVDTDPIRQALTRSLVTFSDEIGAALVAEGVETDSELAMLRRLGVRFGQGYLFAQPGPLPDHEVVA